MARRAPSGRRRKASQKRLAWSIIGLFFATVLATVLVSCFARRDEPDYSIPRHLPGAPIIRAAIVRGAAEARVEVRGPFALYAEDGSGRRGEPLLRGEALPATAATAAGGRAALGSGGLSAERLALVPEREGTLVVEGTGYRGDLLLVAAPDGKLLAINRLNLEAYVAGVVGCEMPLSFPEAALRAQAVAARTYALYQSRGRRGEAYDVAADQSSQVYKGLANETEKSRRVTVETLGLVLSYRQEIFCTYFHSTCGGRTIPAAYVFGAGDITPLSGAACGFCESSKYYRWRLSLPKPELAGKLAGAGFDVDGIGRVEVAERGPGGHAALVRVPHQGGELKVKGARFRTLIGTSAVRSTWFDIDDRGSTLEIAGNGWGHGVGMCQVGAKGMAEAGYGTADILRNYYPAAEITALYRDLQAPP